MHAALALVVGLHLLHLLLLFRREDRVGLGLGLLVQVFQLRFLLVFAERGVGLDGLGLGHRVLMDALELRLLIVGEVELFRHLFVAGLAVSLLVGGGLLGGVSGAGCAVRGLR